MDSSWKNLQIRMPLRVLYDRYYSGYTERNSLQ